LPLLQSTIQGLTERWSTWLQVSSCLQPTLRDAACVAGSRTTVTPCGSTCPGHGIFSTASRWVCGLWCADLALPMLHVGTHEHCVSPALREPSSILPSHCATSQRCVVDTSAQPRRSMLTTTSTPHLRSHAAVTAPGQLQADAFLPPTPSHHQQLRPCAC
jgi:hypothetical protein